MATNPEVYHYEELIERLLARIRESQLVEENRQALESFKRWLVANGLSGARTNKYLIETFKLAQLRESFKRQHSIHSVTAQSQTGLHDGTYGRHIP